MDFEKKISRLEEIVAKMEKGDLALEDSLKMFEEGVKLSQDCQKQLGEVESKIKLLTAVTASGVETTDFHDDEA